MCIKYTFIQQQLFTNISSSFLIILNSNTVEGVSNEYMVKSRLQQIN